MSVGSSRVAHKHPHGTGVSIARELLREKVQSQLSLLDSLPGGEGARADVRRALAEIERAGDIAGVPACELRAAGAYC